MGALANTLKSIGSARIAIMLFVAIAMVSGFIVVGLKTSTANMAPLYTGLSLEDSAKIVAELEKTATPYEILGNGSEIMVPNDRVLRLRMNMAQQGIPSAGSVVGYEIFDRSETLGTSNLVMNINMIRALEGELSRTIASIADVDVARVHLVMPKQELFSRDKEKPSASITIKMRGGHSLDHGEVTAITHLVASAVPGLDANKVTVVDNHGRLLARGDGESETAGSSNAMEYRVAYETKIQKNLEDLIEKAIGPGKVRVQVSADINFDRVVTNSEKYDPDGQVARSVQSNTDRDNSQEKSGKEGVSVAGNLPQGATGGDAGNNSNHLAEHSNETTNYEISKTVQNHISEGGNVNKVSVAVLVDGDYASGADGKQTYTPRSDDELKKLKLLVSSAIGYDEKRGDKIEIVNMKFTDENASLPEGSFFDKFKLEMQSIIQTLIIAVVAILAIVLVLRPAVTQLIAQSGSPSERVGNQLSALEGGASGGAGRLPPGGAPIGPGGQPLPSEFEEPFNDTDRLIDVANIKGGMKESTIKKVNNIVSEKPEETMNVLRKWVAAP